MADPIIGLRDILVTNWSKPPAPSIEDIADLDKGDAKRVRMLDGDIIRIFETAHNEAQPELLYDYVNEHVNITIDVRTAQSRERLSELRDEVRRILYAFRKGDGTNFDRVIYKTRTDLSDRTKKLFRYTLQCEVVTFASLATSDDVFVNPATGAVVGSTTYQTYDGDLAAIANLTPTDGHTIVGNGTTWVTSAVTGDITGVTAGTGLSGGGSSGAVTLNVAGLTISEFAANTIQLSSESFADNDTSLMTSAAIADKIESYGYTTQVGDITGVTAGSGLTGGGTSGTVTVSLDLKDEDNMASNSATHAASQQSIKAYVDSEVTSLIDSAPGALNTLNELAAALNDDASFSSTITTSIGTKLAKASNLSDLANAGTARSNLGLGTLATLSSIDISSNTNLAASAPIVLTGDTLSLADPANLSELNESTDATDDKILLWDESGSAWKYMTLDNLQDSIDTSSNDTNTTYGISTAVSSDDANIVLTDSNGTTDTVKIAAGTNISVSHSTDTITLAATNTQLSTEAVQDIIGSMVDGGTETRIGVTYDDTNGKINFVVDDMTADTNTFRTVTAGGNTLGASETLAFTAGSNVSISESGGAVTIASTDTNTTYSVGDGGLTQNNFTDALKSKLDGIEASADVTDAASVKSALGGAMGSNALQIGDGSTTTTFPGSIVVTGTTTTNHVETVSTSNGVVFEGSNADNNEVTLKAATVSADRTITLPDATGTIALTSQLTSDTNTQNVFTSSFVDSTNDILLRLTKSGASSGTQDIKFVAGSNITLTHTDANNITIASTDTNTTYSVGDGGLTQNNFTDALKSKLDGIAASANNYVHPNHSGEVTSTADGATVIASNVVDEDNLKVTNSPTDNHLLSYDSASGGFTWVAAGAGGENNQNAFSTISVSGQDDVVADAATDTLTFAAGSNVTLTTNASNDTVTIASADTNTQLSTEQVQDIVGAMFGSNTETRITATYQDGDGTIDLVVDDMTADTNTFRTITAGGNTLGASETLAFTAGSNVTISESGGAVTIASTDTNTEYSVGDGGLTQNNFTNALKSKLDGIAASANNYSISSDLLDEDNMASNSATKAASQQSIKAYVDAEVAGLVDTAPAALNTLNELAAALGDDANFSTTTATSLGEKLVKTSNLSDLANAGTARSNLGLGAAAVKGVATDGAGGVADGESDLVTGNAVFDYIAAQGFGTGAGDITAVVAGTGLSGGATSGSATVNLSHLGIESLSDPGADRLLIWDDSAGAIVFATPNDNLAISGTNVNATDTNTNTFRTITAGGNTLGSSETLAFTAGSNVTITESGGAVTIAATDTNTNTQLSDEQVQDIVGAMFSSNTETGITVTYQDGDGTIDLDTTGNKILANSVQLSGASTTNFRVTTGAAASSGASLSFVGSDGNIITDLTIPSSSGTISLSDTQLSTEQVQDIVGAMFSSNTETRISATYQDGDGTIDLVVDDMTTDTNTFRTVTAGGNTLGSTETLAFTAGSNVTISESGGAVTIAATDTNTQLTLKDEDDMASNSATAAASQQSIKAYVDAEVSGLVDSAPSALNTLNELAAALGDDASFSSTVSTSLGNRLRVDVNNQGLNGTQQGNARTNLGLGAAALKAVATDGSGGVADGEAGLVTGNAVFDYIAAQGFGAGSGDITAVVAGTGLSGGATSGSATVNLSHLGIESLSDPGADRLLIWDDSAGAVVFATPNSNLAISGTNVNATDTNTTYSVGDGGLTQNNFTDALKSKLDGIAANATANTGDITGVTAGTGLSGGGSSGSVTLNVSGLTVSELAAGSIQLSSESFVDNDTSLMTSAAINDRIESFGYTTNTGDITGVTAGTGLSGGGSSGGVTLNVSGLTVSEIAAGSILVAGESFADNDTSLMTAAAINDRIESFGYTTNTGDITGVTAGTGLSGGGSSGSVTLNVSGLTVSEIAAGSILVAGETFADNDTSLMTAAAINDRIESFGYTTNTGDITGVTAGTGLSGGGSSGGVTLNIDLKDEDDMSSNSATHAASQQSIKAYVDTEVAGLVDSAPAALNTLNELAAALGDDASFSTTITNSIGTKLAKSSNLSDLANAGTARTNLGLGSLATLSSVAFSNIAGAAVQLSSESFADNDTSLMTSAAINDRIESFGYTTNTGDITAVVAGTGLSGGATSGSATVNLSHLGIESLSDPNADRILIWDDSAGAVAWATPNDNLAISGTNVNATDTNTQLSTEQVQDIAGPLVATGGTKTRISVTYDDANNNMDFVVDDMNFSVSDITGATALTSGLASADEFVINDAGVLKRMDTSVLQTYMQNNLTFTTDTDTTYSAGTNISLSGTTFNVDDAFLINNGDDTTTGTITAGGFTTAGSITLGGHAVADIDIGSEFVDTDDHLMSSGAIKEKIESYSYGTGDATLAGTQTFTGAKTFTSDVNLDGAGLNINKQYSRINFKKDATNNAVNNAAIFFYNASDSIRGAINYMYSLDRLGFNAGGDYQLYITDGAIYPPVDSDVDLGTTSLRFKDTFVDSITVTGEVDAASLDISGDADIDGTLEADAITIGGTAIAAAGTTSITTLGTIGTGTWQGTAIAQAYIADQAINEAKLQVSNAPTNGYVLTAQSGNTGGLTWAAASSGGASQLSDLSDVALVSNSLVAGSPSASMSGSQFNAGFGRGTLGLLSSGDNNSAIGFNALGGLNTGSNNTANGYNAGATITSGSRNTVIGYGAGDGFDTENDNIAIGYDALGGPVAGGEKNVVIGNYAGDAVTSADNTILVGYEAGSSITSSTDSIGIGYQAGKSMGNQTIAIGSLSASIGTGWRNVMIGYGAGKRTTDHDNVVIGWEAGDDGTAYGQSVFIGSHAGKRWGIGDYNIAIGYGAGGQQDAASGNDAQYNTVIGHGSGDNVTDGDYNIFLGQSSGDNITTGSNNVVIGAADVSSATGDDQLSISSGDGGVTWITGDSNGGIASKAQVVAVTGNTTLTEAQSGSYVYWTAGTLTLPANATVGTQFTIFNNSGGSGTVGLGTNNSIVSGGASNAAVSDNDSTSYICVSATNWWQVG